MIIMTNTNIQAILDQKLQGVEARKFTAEITKDFGVANQSELLVYVAELVEKTDEKFAEELATFLYLKAQQFLPKVSKKSDGKKLTKAQIEAKENAEKIMEEGLQEGVYYDTIGLLATIGLDVSEPKGRGTRKYLEEVGYIVQVEKKMKFEDGKTRTAFILAEQNDIEEKDFVPCDSPLAEKE